MAEQNKEWSLQIDVTGEQFFKPGTFDRLADGCHEVIVVSTWREPATTKNDDGSAKQDNIVFELKALKGPDKDKVVRKYKSTVQGDPGSAARKEWKNLLATVVKDPAALESGAKTLKAGFFVGKTVFIYVQNPPEGQKDAKGRTPFAQINFITKDMVAELSAKTASRTGNASANGSSAPKGEAKTFTVDTGGAAAPQPGADVLE